MKVDLNQDFDGESYDDILARLHDVLNPQSYLEIGVCHGHTLRFSKCDTIAVDPHFDFNNIDIVKDFIRNKKSLHLFQRTSDEFFEKYSPTDLFNRPVDMAFLDGMHRAEYLLRDFINTEEHCRKNSVIIMHDCLPLELGMAAREVNDNVIVPHRAGWWAGDVWKTALLLKRERPDLHITAINAPPTGLVIVTNLNPKNSSLKDEYHHAVDKMHRWHLNEIGIESYFEEMQLEPTTILNSSELVTRRYWL